MVSVRFEVGDVYFVSDSHTEPWSLVFEDDGDAGYLYAYDRFLGKGEPAILDAVLIYNVSAVEKRERLAAVQWSRDGLQAVLYVDGSAQALVDFAARETYCRSNFPTFRKNQGDKWRTSSHTWNEEALQRFEADVDEQSRR